MTRRLGALAVLIAACAPSTTGDSTTTSAVPTTTTIASTTTLATTTTTVPIATTSTSTTTTTTLAPTTTTTLAPGNWASQPLITTAFGALGWWDGAIWLTAQDEGSLPVTGGEDYQVAVIGLQATTTGGPETIVCEPFVNNLGVVLANEDMLGQWPGPYGVAISAPWDLQPYLVQAFPDDGTYATHAQTLLANRGLNVASPVIKQLFRVDLEGDGINEVIVVAESLTNGYLPVAGDYSIAFLRKVVQGDVQTAILGVSIVTDPNTQFPLGYSIGAVADLNGDGKMEIVLDTAAFEGLAVAVWEYANDDLGPIQVFETGCGS